jgi:hypothetical protein
MLEGGVPPMSLRIRTPSKLAQESTSKQIASQNKDLGAIPSHAHSLPHPETELQLDKAVKSYPALDAITTTIGTKTDGNT